MISTCAYTDMRMLARPGTQCNGSCSCIQLQVFPRSFGTHDYRGGGGGTHKGSTFRLNMLSLQCAKFIFGYKQLLQK